MYHLPAIGQTYSPFDFAFRTAPPSTLFTTVTQEATAGLN